MKPGPTFGLAQTWRRQDGASLMEFALTIPVVVWILLGIFDLGRAVYAQNAIANAAREGARYGSISPDDTSGITDAVEDAIIALEMESITIEIEQPTSDTIRVTVSYQFAAATPFIANILGSGGLITLQATSTMEIEATA